MSFRRKSPLQRAERPSRGDGRGVNPPFAEHKGVRGMPYYVILNVAKRSEESKPERWRFLAPLGMTWGECEGELPPLIPTKVGIQRGREWEYVPFASAQEDRRQGRVRAKRERRGYRGRVAGKHPPSPIALREEGRLLAALQNDMGF